MGTTGSAFFSFTTFLQLQMRQIGGRAAGELSSEARPADVYLVEQVAEGPIARSSAVHSSTRVALGGVGDAREGLLGLGDDAFLAEQRGG